MGRAHHPSLQRESIEVTARMKVAITGDQSTASECPGAELAVSKPFAAAGEVVRRLAGLQVLADMRERRRFPAGSWSSRPALGTSCAPVRLAPAIDARAPRRGI